MQFKIKQDMNLQSAGGGNKVLSYLLWGQFIIRLFQSVTTWWHLFFMQGDSPLWNSAQENTNSDSLRCFAPPKKSRLGPGWSQQERRNVNARRVHAHKKLQWKLTNK